MSARQLRLTLASALVVFAASACSSITAPDEASSNIDAFGGTPLSDEHQGSDSLYEGKATVQHTEHQGSDS